MQKDIFSFHPVYTDFFWQWGRASQSCGCIFTQQCQPATTLCFVSVSPPGFHSLCISSALLLLCAGLGAPLGYLFELMLPLAMCAIAMSFLFSVYLYARSFWAASHALALGGNTGECRVFVVRWRRVTGNTQFKRSSLLKHCAFVGWLSCLLEDFWYSCG